MGGAEIPACIFMPSVVLQALVCILRINYYEKIVLQNAFKVNGIIEKQTF